MVTKEQLDTALSAWKAALERTQLEQSAWVLASQNHLTLIQSLLKHGHSWSDAKAEVEKLQEFHRDSHLAAFVAMHERFEEYSRLQQMYRNQQ